MDYKISLCIPTMNRFDTFLGKYLDSYVEYLKEGIINEIVISDENGNDYEKISKKYKNIIGENFRIFQNNNVLGIFLNKLSVCSKAKNNFIALIDSDNFVDRDYFKKTINFYKEKIESTYCKHFIISPSILRKTTLNYNNISNICFNKKNSKDYINMKEFETLLNTGNYIISKDIISELKYDLDIVKKVYSYDVIYMNLLIFEQFDDLQFYAVKDLSYEHIVHSGSEWINTHSLATNLYNNYIMPKWKNLV
jgi:hypothetical protein